jgi:hypothetical protein
MHMSAATSACRVAGPSERASTDGQPEVMNSCTSQDALFLVYAAAPFVAIVKHGHMNLKNIAPPTILWYKTTRSTERARSKHTSPGSSSCVASPPSRPMAARTARREHQDEPASDDSTQPIKRARRSGGGTAPTAAPGAAAAPRAGRQTLLALFARQAPGPALLQPPTTPQRVTRAGWYDLGGGGALGYFPSALAHLERLLPALMGLPWQVGGPCFCGSGCAPNHIMALSFLCMRSLRSTYTPTPQLTPCRHCKHRRSNVLSRCTARKGSRRAGSATAPTMRTSPLRIPG